MSGMKRKAIVGIIAAGMIVIVAGAVFLYIGRGSVKVDGQMELAYRCVLDKDYEGAAAAFEAVTELDQGNAEAYLGLAKVLKEADDLESAVKVLEKGLELTESYEIHRLLEEYRRESEKQTLAAQAEEESTPVQPEEPTPVPQEEPTPLPTGFVTQDGAVYYYDGEGNPVLGWFEEGGNVYCAGNDGRLYRDGEYEIDSKKFQFDQDGICLGEVKDDRWKQAYINIVNECEAADGQGGKYTYGLIYFDDDEMPELLTRQFDGTQPPIESIYTYDEGMIYTIMDEWMPGQFEDYEYAPRKSVVRATPSSAGGYAEYEWIPNDTHKLIQYVEIRYDRIWGDENEFEYEEPKYFHYVGETDWKGENEEITAEEYYAYYIDGDFVWLSSGATKSADEVIDAINETIL